MKRSRKDINNYEKREKTRMERYKFSDLIQFAAVKACRDVSPRVHIGGMRLCAVACVALIVALAYGSDKEMNNMKTLPAPETTGKISVEETIAKRRSVRSFVDDKLSDKQISQLLWAAQGITLESRGLRAAPSAGATYPLETYVVCQDGLFRYVPDRHALEKIKDGDHRGDLSDAALGQQCVADAPVSIVFTAIPERTTKRYGERGRMYIHMEAGHAAENIHLQAVAMGLGSVPVGAFDDGKVAELLGVSAPEIPLYIIPVGKPRGR